MDIYERLENCDVGEREPAMTSAEAMESLVLHQDCLTAMCERKNGGAADHQDRRGEDRVRDGHSVSGESNGARLWHV
ncbi:hypothetical protein ACQP1O_10790 [Nocardia sp. CA-151230]|uniref:hypothetical protein n=1 Tax=Nocardia sp. CA-151230 TaxID=3239982 RepID=UPI003D91FB2C